MSLLDSTKAIYCFLLPPREITDWSFTDLALEMIEKSEVWETDFFDMIESMIETDLPERRNSSSGSY
jgi:hypothetical protein